MRTAFELPSAATRSTAGTKSAAPSMPRSAGRTTSPCETAMPPASCARYSPKAACRIRRSSSVRTVRRFQPLRPAEHFPQARHVGRNPCEAVGGELVALKRVRVGPAAGLHARRHAAARLFQIGPGRAEGLFEEGDREGHGFRRMPLSGDAVIARLYTCRPQSRCRTHAASRPEPDLQALPLSVGLRCVAHAAAHPLAAGRGAAFRRRDRLAAHPHAGRTKPAHPDLPLLYPSRCRGEQLLHEALRARLRADRGADDAGGILQYRDGAYRRLQPFAGYGRDARKSSIRPSCATRRCATNTTT